MKLISKKVKKEIENPYSIDVISKKIGEVFKSAGITKKVKLSELDIAYAYDDDLSVLKLKKKRPKK